ncbi:MAG: hypothetical protein HQL52_20070 [Magnetococcales bacterium]|nr:hypothetical protein [Magnetococcales bacterium]
MVIIIPQYINFSHSSDLSIPEIAKTLTAMDRITRKVATASTLLEPTLGGATCSVTLSQLQSGSLLTDLIFKFMLSEKQAEQLKRDFSEMPTKQFLEKHGVLLKVLLGLCILGGGSAALKAVSPAAPTYHIEHTYNHFYETGKGLGVPEERLNQAVNVTLKKEKQAAEDAVRLVSPARRDPNGAIDFGSSLRIPPEALWEFPEKVTWEPTTESIDGTEVLIRATDRDKTDSGWSAIVPAFSEKRLTLKIDPSLDLSRLASHENVTGDITVEFKTSASGRRKPAGYFLADYRVERENK